MLTVQFTDAEAREAVKILAREYAVTSIRAQRLRFAVINKTPWISTEKQRAKWLRDDEASAAKQRRMLTKLLGVEPETPNREAFLRPFKSYVDKNKWDGEPEYRDKLAIEERKRVVAAIMAQFNAAGRQAAA